VDAFGCSESCGEMRSRGGEHGTGGNMKGEAQERCVKEGSGDEKGNGGQRCRERALFPCSFEGEWVLSRGGWWGHGCAVA